MQLYQLVANRTQISLNQVSATLKLFNEGATVPFVARYRKEVTGGLDDTQLRQLDEQHRYCLELFERRETILNSIESQGKLTPELKKRLNETDSKTRLEDLYLPYKPKRRTKAQMAKEAGLEPLAETLMQDLNCDPQQVATNYVDEKKSVADVSAALDGARAICMEMFAENADLLEQLRACYWQHAVIASKVVKDKQAEAQKFADYFEFSERIETIPSHRLLALLRGRKEGGLQLKVQFEDELTMQQHCCELVAKAYGKPILDKGHWLQTTIEWAYKIKLHLKLELEIMMTLKQRAELEAINVFSGNLKNLLLAAPAGKSVVLGLDPGYRTGVKTVVVDATGKLLDYCVIYPHAPQKKWNQSLAQLQTLCLKYQVKLISVGNGTASRETDQLAAELVRACSSLAMTKIMVSEAGASVYSASALAAKEFPDLDVSYRGAVSIARRLQDPLAELVKIEPKAIGVGQYQHDVNQVKLARTLKATVEDCVNAVGADVNTASVALLSSIAGLNETIAQNIVTHRDQQGRYDNRQSLKQVPRLGDKTFEQAAGFLRVNESAQPLDRSGVHPESYAVVEQMAQAVGCEVSALIGHSAKLDSLKLSNFVSDTVGMPTLRDIVAELKKPGRDPRPEFKMAQFKEGVVEVKDLLPGMQLEGVITNVANFGAFVDVGVHQDGLVHVSQLADHFVEDVHQLVKVGQIVQVRVLEVDLPRKRISLSMKSGNTPKQAQQNRAASNRKPHKKQRNQDQSPFQNNLASQLQQALTES